MYNNNLFQNTTDTSINGNNNYVNNDNDLNVTMTNNDMSSGTPTGGCMNNGVRERVVHRTYVHDVPHTCPIHTRIINHHVYRHTYRPVYTCSEENVCSNVECGSCSQFR